MENRFRFIRVRDVRPITRANEGDAGLDFYFPKDITFQQLVEANSKVIDVRLIDRSRIMVNDSKLEPGSIGVHLDPKGRVYAITLAPHSRVIIPSGIKGLIEPRNSAFIAANKSGVSTKLGLIITAQVVDSPYTGEIHLGVFNSSNVVVKLEADEKVVQFLHVPIYLTTPEEISGDLYEDLSKDWGTRGSNWQGSSN